MDHTAAAPHAHTHTCTYMEEFVGFTSLNVLDIKNDIYVSLQSSVCHSVCLSVCLSLSLSLSLSLRFFRSFMRVSTVTPMICIL